MPVTTRPMSYDDIDAAATIVEVNDELEMRREGREPPVRDAARRAAFRKHLRRFLDLDAPGAWVATNNETVVGLGTAVRRGAFWGLSLLYVQADWQSQGIGRLLLDRTLTYGDDAAVKMVTTSPDPRALRRYALAGLVIHPAVAVQGPVDRTAIPADLPVRQGDATDLDLVAAVDEYLGLDRVADIEYMLHEANGQLTLVDRGSRRGFAVHRYNGVTCLGATDNQTAAEVLWGAFAEFDGDTFIECLTAQQDWAVQVALCARLSVTPSGPLFLAGLPEPPGPWIPSGWYF